MPTLNLGRVGSVPKGNWTAGTYKKLDIVRHNGAAWQCKAASTTTQEPSDIASDWMKLVEDGAALDASDIPFSPTGNISSTNVQAALAEVDSEKVASANGTVSNLTITDGYTEETASSSGTAFTFSFANGTVQSFTTTGNTTITLPAVAAGKSFQIQIAFGGSHTLGFAGGAVAWSDNTTPTFSGAAGKTDVINFVANVAGTKWLGALHGKGYV